MPLSMSMPLGVLLLAICGACNRSVRFVVYEHEHDFTLQVHNFEKYSGIFWPVARIDYAWIAERLSPPNF